MNNCLFCKIANKELPAIVLDENEKVIVFLSLENHPLIVPKQHIENIYSLDDETGSEIMREAIKIAKAVKTSLNCDGINLVQSNESSAGQEVPHFHLHIKPRWKNDEIKLSWDFTTVPEHKRLDTAEMIKSVLID